MKLTYKNTKLACFLSYLVQGITNNISPLLFVVFSEQLGLSFVELSLLITINFTFQIAVDLLSSVISKFVSYRCAIICAHTSAFIGLFSIPLLVYLIPDNFSALCISTVLMSIGSGLLEVFVSPIVEAIPENNKMATMNILHSFYCWGQVGVIAISTLYFAIFKIDNWQYLPILWSIVPIVCAVMFFFVPIRMLDGDEKGSHRFLFLFQNKNFWLMMIIMLCAGAAEMGAAQWASLFCEVGLGVSKYLGDLLGPCSFAVFMGLGRVIFGSCKLKNTPKWICISFGICSVAYLIIALAPHPLISLLGFALCGISVSILWPGTYSMGAQAMPQGGSVLFALFAMMGDIGCALGPDVIGIISDRVQTEENIISTIFSGSAIEAGMKTGILIATIIPIIGFAVSLVFIMINKEKRSIN